ncbi:MAG: TMEM14 family protein [Chthoniobacterales bacterium]|nr:TMEM14 family protein [Chthoniobacterales bacterium]
MFSPTKIYFIVFGLLTIAGGVMGYVKAGSTASLIAGSISGILLLVAAFLLPGQVVAGLILGGIVSLLLAAQFLPAFFRTGKMMPAGMMSLLSILGVVFAVAAWIRK